MTDDDLTAPDPTGVRVTGGERPVIEVTVAAPVEVVWPHLRDRQLIRRWHGWEDESLDAEIELIYERGAEADDSSHVLRTENGDRFEALPLDRDTTVVRITRGPRGGEWADMHEDITEGWITFLAQLRFAVERHPGAERRTVFRGRFGPGTAVGTQLGTADLGTAVGDPYRLETAGSPRLQGTVWYRTAGQLGLTVDAYGPGLLVVADKPGPEPGSSAVSMIVVSTFGLSPDGHEAVEQDWSAWWSAHQPAGGSAPED